MEVGWGRLAKYFAVFSPPAAEHHHCHASVVVLTQDCLEPLWLQERLGSKASSSFAKLLDEVMMGMVA